MPPLWTMQSSAGLIDHLIFKLNDAFSLREIFSLANELLCCIAKTTYETFERKIRAVLHSTIRHPNISKDGKNESWMLIILMQNRISILTVPSYNILTE